MKHRFTSSLGAFFILTAAACGTVSAAASVHYRAYRTPEPIVLDGKPDEAVWSRVPKTAQLTLAPVQSGNAVPTHADSAAHVYAKAVWDGTAVYFYFWVDEQYMWNRRIGRDTLGFWLENALEIYLDDIGDNKQFLESNLALNGSITDIYNEYKYSGTANNTVLGYDIAGIATGVAVQGTLCTTYSASAPCNKDLDTGFGMEVKIPFASLKAIGPTRIDVMGANFHAPPRNLDSCRINLFYTSCAPKATEPANQDRVNYAWDTDVGNDFHETSKFGTMTFVDSVLTGDVTHLIRGAGAAAGGRWETCCKVMEGSTNMAGRWNRTGTAAGIYLLSPGGDKPARDARRALIP
jgi:hypothetical protein